MTALPSPDQARSRPDPPPAEPAVGLQELDQRILEAERRLIAREQGLREQVQRLRQRAVTEPRRLLSPALGTLTAMLAVGWLARSRRPAPGMALAPSSSRDTPWVRYLGLAWPLLPLAWRSRISPATATTVLSLGIPMLENLLGGSARRAAHTPLDTVPVVDLARYAGRWYEIARLPMWFEDPCHGQPTAEYRPGAARSRGAPTVEVINRCADARGRVREARGLAKAVPGGGGARLKVSLGPSWLRWLPGAWADYWILSLDADYSEALVGEPSRRYLWLLSRQPSMPRERIDALLAQAQRQGFDVARVIVSQR